MNLNFMDDEASCGTDCCREALAKGLHLLQEKWVLLIVHSLLKGPVGFNELSRKARGVNPTTMSQRLDRLEQVGIVTKTVHSTMPPRTSYELTSAGHELGPVLLAIEEWSEKHMSGSQCPT